MPDFFVNNSFYANNTPFTRLKCIYDFRLVFSFKTGWLAIMEGNTHQLGHRFL